MWKELFAGADLLSLPVITMLLFLVFFGGIVIWVFSKKRKDKYDRISRLPLEGGEES